MSEKKTVSRNVAILLAIICIILIAGVFYSDWYIRTMQNNYNDLENQNKQLQTLLNNNVTLLNMTESWLNGNITYCNSQVTNLTNQLSTFTPARLGFTDLVVEDNRTNPQTPQLHISGVVQNFGIENSTQRYYGWGYDGILDIRAYHSDGSVAIKTTKELDNVGGQSSTNIIIDLSYSGTAITSWELSLGILGYI